MAMALVGCTQEEAFDNGAGLKVLNVKVEGYRVSSRVGFTDGDADFFWTKGDKIGTTTTQSSSFQGMTLEGEGGGTSGKFTGNMSGDPSGYAVYPYGEMGRHSVSEDVLSYTLPASYTYTTLDAAYAKADGNSYNAPMWGKVTNGSASFKHLGGVIAFSVNGLPESTSGKFVLTATNKINGTFTATLTDSEPVIATEATDVAAEKTVTIEFSTAEGQTSGYFYLPVPTGTLGNLMLAIVDTNDNEFASGAWDNITIKRADIRRATIGEQSITGGLVQEVTAIDKITDEVLTSEEEELTVQISEEVKGADNTITIPSALQTNVTTFSFTSIADDAVITIENASEASYTGQIIIEIPENETIPTVNANIPDGEVYIKQGTVTALVTSSAANTTIIGSNATVGTLTVKKGNVRIEDGGKVSTINRSEDNEDDVTYVIYEAATAPGITLGENQQIVLVSAAEWDLRKAIADVNISSYQLTQDIVLGDILTIPSGKTFTLDLNGKTISQVKECTASYEMIANNGTLTITGNGKISFKDTGTGDPNFGWGSYAIRNSGSLTIENGTIEHLGEQEFATHMICAIFQYSGSTIIKDGTISTPAYRSARLWKGNMTIEGGTFDGQLWVQSVDDSAELTINDGTFEPNGRDGSSVFVENTNYKVAFSVTGGTFNTKIGCSDATKEGVKGSVKGGIFTESAKTGTNSNLLAAGYDFEAKEDGTYTLVYDASKLVVTSSAELNDALANNEITTIKLGADLTISSTLSITRDITLDGNGKTLTYTGTDRAFQITGGTVVINDLTVNMPGNTPEGSRGINLYNGDTNKAIDVTLNNVTVNGYKAYAVNIGGGKDNKLTINNSTLTGYAAINVNVASVNHTIVVDGSTLNGKNHNNGFHFGTVVVDGTNAHSLTITESSITTENLEGVTSEYYPVIVGANCTYNVCEGIDVAVRNVYEETGGLYHIGLASAIEVDDAKIKLLANIELENMIAIPSGKTVTLDLNGKTITGTDNATSSFGLINLNPGSNLTIKSTTAEGKIMLTATNNRGWNAYSSVISNQRATLTVGTNVVIEHLGGTDMAYGIDNLTNTGTEHAKTTIEGATIKSTYRAIRQFLNSTAAGVDNVLHVKSGIIEGANKSIWMQNANAQANPGKLTVEANAQLKGDVLLSGASSTEWPVEVSIAKVALVGDSEVTPSKVSEDFAVVLNNGNYVVKKVTTKSVSTLEELKTALTEAGAAGSGYTTINITADINMNGQAWTPISIDGYHGADIVTVEGNEHVITGLTAGLFKGGFAGGSGIIIKNLTIDDSNIVADNTQGYGAFVGCADSMDEITLIKCHLKNSTIITPNDGAAESRIGGLIGWTAGYNNQNDGPVDSYITVKECSVTGCTLKGAGSIGGIVGHAGANAATFTTIEDCTVTGNTFTSTDDGGWRVGVVVGTANNGQCIIKNITASNNTLSQTGKTAPEGQSNLYGRFVPSGTGTLTIDGVEIE